MTEPAGVIDVAGRAGVSIGELGFVRNEAARQLRAGRSRTVGLVVLDVGNPFFTDLAAGVEKTADQHGLSVVLCNSGDDAEREEHHLSLLQEQRAFGILITPVARKTPAVDVIRRRGTPVVLVDHASSTRQCSVSVNDQVGGEFAVAHLITQGHKRIAFVGGPLSIKQVSERLAGARQALRAAGLRPGALTVMETPALNVAAGRQTGDVLADLPDRSRPTAVFCANDLLALGVLQTMTRRGLRVPGDLAIVGYDDIDFASAAAVPLTSVRQPSAQLGQAAMELLIDEAQASQSHQHRQVVFEPELVVRESTVLG